MPNKSVCRFASLPGKTTARGNGLFLVIDTEFTYSFGGCTTNRGLDGSYLSRAGLKMPDRINLVYTDIPVALSTNFEFVAAYAGESKRSASESLSEEVVLLSSKFITRFENKDAHNNSMDVVIKLVR